MPGDLPVVAADRDANDAVTAVSASTGTTVASVDVTAPAAGCVVVQGAVEIDNDGLGTTFTLRLLKNSSAVSRLAWANQFAGTDTNPGERQILGGTGAFTVDAGTTTVGLEVVPAAARDFTYNGQSLVATWYPSSQCSVSTQA